MSSFNVDECISCIFKGELLPPEKVTAIFDLAKPILRIEPNILRLQSPISICGDTHGQLYDVIHLFETAGPASDKQYLFLGDYVDRGYFSIELICLLLCYKIKRPTAFYLLRGNHETRSVNYEYGFFEEIGNKYGSTDIWEAANNLFDYFPIAAIISDQFFCIHGGICPMLSKLNQISEINRFEEPPIEGLIANLLWSDPQETYDVFKRSERRTGYYFGEKQVSKFLEDNSLKTIIRSHEMVEGRRIMYQGKLIIIWSAPNYCYVCHNKAAVLEIDENNHISYTYFTPMPKERRKIPTISSFP